MKILAIGDFHGKFPSKLKKEVEKADLVLCTGDLGGSDKLLKIIFKYFKHGWWKIVGLTKAKKYVLEDYSSGKKIINELGKLKNKIYIINGNWDFTSTAPWERTAGLKLEKYTKLMRRKKNLISINRSFKKINGLGILFFGGMVTAGAYVDGALGKTHQKKSIKKNQREQAHLMKYASKDVDILLAHYPPFGYFDKVSYKGENPMNGKHIGFKGYTAFIKKKQPKIFICGHMHEYQGKKKLGKTTIITTGSAHDGKAVIIDFDVKKKKVNNVKFVV